MYSNQYGKQRFGFYTETREHLSLVVAFKILLSTVMPISDTTVVAQMFMDMQSHSPPTLLPSTMAAVTPQLCR